MGNLDYLPPSSPPPPSPASGWGSFYDEESNEQFEETSSDKCKGQLIEWVAGSVWDTYAYQQHDDDSEDDGSPFQHAIAFGQRLSWYRSVSIYS